MKSARPTPAWLAAKATVGTRAISHSGYYVDLEDMAAMYVRSERTFVCVFMHPISEGYPYAAYACYVQLIQLRAPDHIWFVIRE
jgi:hypothetical protein